jgi:chromosome segregation ATPase
MGLAASQARLLTLNSRKSDLEFQGQQVNQERTILANQTETFYNQILALDVPNAEENPVTYDPVTKEPTNDSDGDGLSDKYEAELISYSAEYNRINAKIESTHQQDRTLETTLKNIDTQHSAVQTEIESVKKVIDKTVETTYKTFQ